MAEGIERERALALVQAGEFTFVHVRLAGNRMLCPHEARFLVWTQSKPEAVRRAHAYCKARGWQLDLSRDWEIDWSGIRPVAPLREALRVHPAREALRGHPARHRAELLSARQCVMDGEYEPLPTEPV